MRTPPGIYFQKQSEDKGDKILKVIAKVKISKERALFSVLNFHVTPSQFYWGGGDHLAIFSSSKHQQETTPV